MKCDRSISLVMDLLTLDLQALEILRTKLINMRNGTDIDDKLINVNTAIDIKRTSRKF